MTPLQFGYYLLAVSRRENLELCIRHALAGLPSSLMGAWAYVELRPSDFVSFLYGARVFNLYKVLRKEAWENAENAPPWKPITFRESGQTYYFPFRVWLEPLREFEEPLVRPEFAYVAENLLLRGGYRKTHFQADFTTFQVVSQLGIKWHRGIMPLNYQPASCFELKFLKGKKDKMPYFRWQEVILQAAVKRYLQFPQHFVGFAKSLSLPFPDTQKIEVLSEKALPEGHIDLLLKEAVLLENAVPVTNTTKIPIEVKLSKATKQDLMQLQGYINELRKSDECPCGILIAADFSKRLVEEARRSQIHTVRYQVKIDLNSPQTFDDIVGSLVLEPIAPV